MTTLRNRRVTLVWVALIVATLVSAWVGIAYGAGAARTVTVVVMIIAFVKLNLIGLHFMELRDAPWQLRVLFEGWCVVTCGAIIVTFLAF